MPAGGSADRRCLDFLQWALPRLGLRWSGFRKVRRQVCRRLRRQLGQLKLADLDAYREHLEAHPEEWTVLNALTPITISRFHRDAQVFQALEDQVLPAPAAAGAADARDRLGAWGAGCASGEETYRLALLWHGTPAARFPTLRLDVLASDIDPAMLRRAREATYDASSLRDLPARWRDRAFMRRGRALMRAPRAPRPRQCPPPRPAHRAAGLTAWPGTRAIFRRA